MAKKAVSFKALQKTWYKKLAKAKFKDLVTKENPEGHFSDIEMPDGRFKGLSTEFSRDRAVYSYGGLEAKAEYHRLASWFLHEHDFSTELERAIWEYHVNGLSIRDITETLKKLKLKKTNRDFVHKLILDLKQQMLDKYVNKR